jgi:hypothetical protein
MNPPSNKMVDGKVKSETKKNDDMFDDMVAAQVLLKLNNENNKFVRKKRGNESQVKRLIKKPITIRALIFLN